MSEHWGAADGQRLQAWLSEHVGSAQVVADKLGELMGMGVRGSTVARWCAGKTRPAHKYHRLLRDNLGVPPRLLCGGAQLATSQAAARGGGESAAAAPRGSTAMTEIQQLIVAGAPTSEVYQAALRALTSLGALDVAEQRLWTTLLRTLRDEMTASKEAKPLHEHPDWPAARDAMLAAVADIEGAPEKVMRAWGIAAPGVAA